MAVPNTSSVVYSNEPHSFLSERQTFLKSTLVSADLDQVSVPSNPDSFPFCEKKCFDGNSVLNKDTAVLEDADQPRASKSFDPITDSENLTFSSNRGRFDSKNHTLDESNLNNDSDKTAGSNLPSVCSGASDDRLFNESSFGPNCSSTISFGMTEQQNTFALYSRAESYLVTAEERPAFILNSDIDSLKDGPFHQPDVDSITIVSNNAGIKGANLDETRECESHVNFPVNEDGLCGKDSITAISFSICDAESNEELIELDTLKSSLTDGGLFFSNQISHNLSLLSESNFIGLSNDFPKSDSISFSESLESVQTVSQLGELNVESIKSLNQMDSSGKTVYSDSIECISDLIEGHDGAFDVELTERGHGTSSIVDVCALNQGDLVLVGAGGPVRVSSKASNDMVDGAGAVDFSSISAKIDCTIDQESTGSITNAQSAESPNLSLNRSNTSASVSVGAVPSTTFYGKMVKSIRQSFKKILNNCSRNSTSQAALPLSLQQSNPNVDSQPSGNGDQSLNMERSHFLSSKTPRATASTPSSDGKNADLELEEYTSVHLDSTQSDNGSGNLIQLSPITSVSQNEKPLYPPALSVTSTRRLLHKTMLVDVAFPPLLQPPPLSHYNRKCLLLDLDETLVHSTFQFVLNPDLIVPVHLGEGVFQPIYVCKRPGVDAFLRSLAPYFELVIFTASLSNYADPVIDFLDPEGNITSRLYRESCLQLQGLYIKDMSRLGRLMDQVLLVDNSPTSYSLQPENALGCRSWFFDQKDSELCDRLLPLLLKLAHASSVSTWREENRILIDTPY